MTILEVILQSVCDVTGVTREDVVGRSKSRDIVDARYIFVYYCIVYGVPTRRIAEELHRPRTSCVTRMFSVYTPRTDAYSVVVADRVKRLIEERLKRL